jgi:hypothetical protein
MRKFINIEIILIFAIVSYSLIVIKGEHLAGPLGLFIFISLFNNPDWLYCLLPIIGLVLLVISVFSKNRFYIYILSLFCLYPALICYILDLIKDKQFVDEVTPMLSMLPFISLSIFLLVKKCNIRSAPLHL